MTLTKYRIAFLAIGAILAPIALLSVHLAFALPQDPTFDKLVGPLALGAASVFVSLASWPVRTRLLATAGYALIATPVLFIYALWFLCAAFRYCVP